jgi:hypothetical protein
LKVSGFPEASTAAVLPTSFYSSTGSSMARYYFHKEVIMKFPVQLGRTGSIIFSAVYIAVTLGARFYFEPQLHGFYIISIGIGIFMLVFLWALYYIRFLNFQ